MKRSFGFLGIIIGLVLASRVEALNSGSIIARNILGGAGAGALVGFAAGNVSYGMNHNMNPEVLLSGTVYGFIGGALLGTGTGVYEIVNERQDSNFSLFGYIAGGAGIGSLIGGVVATIPYLRDKQGEDFTIGLGVGGLVGAAVGLGLAALDLTTQPTTQTKLLSGKMIIGPQSYALVPLIPEKDREPVISCRLVEITF